MCRIHTEAQPTDMLYELLVFASAMGLKYDSCTMTAAHEQMYSQQSFRDSDGDIFITQFNEEVRPSGIVIPREIGFVSIQSTVSSAAKVNASETGLVFADFSTHPTRNEIKNYAVEPMRMPVFREMSSRAIIDAYSRLLAQDLNPRIGFGAPVKLDNMPEDERTLLTGINSDVDTFIQADKRKRDGSPEPRTGQYL